MIYDLFWLNHRQFKTSKTYLSIDDAKNILEKVVLGLESVLQIEDPNETEKEKGSDMLLAVSIFCLRGQRPGYGLTLQFRAFAPYFEETRIAHLDTFETLEKVVVSKVIISYIYIYICMCWLYKYVFFSILGSESKRFTYLSSETKKVFFSNWKICFMEVRLYTGTYV